MADCTIDHVDIRVSDISVSLAFYEAALAPLGLRPDAEDTDPAGGREIGFRKGDSMSFAIHSPASEPGQDTVTTGAHIAFRAASREAVQAFHAAGVANGRASETRGRATSTPPATTVRSCWTPTATTSRPSCTRADVVVPVTRIDHLVLTVGDLERTIAWYGAVAGMTHLTFGEGRHALTFGQQKINLHLRGHEIEPHAASPTAGSADLCFIVDEAPGALQARLERLGIQIELGPVLRDGAVGELTSYYLRDPDANLVELSSYR
jgi:catechol 2,3-dioxygenase-like lactoylglutathione lyase family enzyme